MSNRNDLIALTCSDILAETLRPAIIDRHTEPDEDEIGLAVLDANQVAKRELNRMKNLYAQLKRKSFAE